MTTSDMSRRAVTLRLVRTSQLRRLCLALGRRPERPRARATAMGRDADEQAEAIGEAEERYRTGPTRGGD
jgi:hypothetical protein